MGKVTGTEKAKRMTKSVVTIYTTFANNAEAELIIDALLDKKLIACANLLPEITSYYNWQDKRQKNTEFAALLKTVKQKQADVIELIVNMHSYDCPCVTIWPISEGNMPYLDWINNETLLP